MVGGALDNGVCSENVFHFIINVLKSFMLKHSIFNTGKQQITDF
ncbi:Uncharacterised protein [Escherichia coli]|nr:Uncharacterised protein [Escherichia coli]